jgi:hypothetical protein
LAAPKVTAVGEPLRPFPEESKAVAEPDASSSFQYPTGESAATAAGYPPAGIGTVPWPGVSGELALVLGVTVVDEAGPVPTAFVADTRT